MSGRKSQRKGYRAENQFVNLIQSYGIGAQRMPLSGALGGAFAGDVKVWAMHSEWLLEGKCRANGFKQIYDWIEPENIDALFLKADRKPYLVVMTAEKFAQLITEAEGEE